MTTDASLVGYDVRGRNGSLGVVVASDVPRAVSPMAESELVVMGGRSCLLRLHIPVSHIAAVSHDAGTVEIDLDVVDFAPRIADDGLVDLRLCR